MTGEYRIYVKTKSVVYDFSISVDLYLKLTQF